MSYYITYMNRHMTYILHTYIRVGGEIDEATRVVFTCHVYTVRCDGLSNF